MALKIRDERTAAHEAEANRGVRREQIQSQEKYRQDRLNAQEEYKMQSQIERLQKQMASAGILDDWFEKNPQGMSTGADLESGRLALSERSAEVEKNKRIDNYFNQFHKAMTSGGAMLAPEQDIAKDPRVIDFTNAMRPRYEQMLKNKERIADLNAENKQLLSKLRSAALKSPSNNAALRLAIQQLELQARKEERLATHLQKMQASDQFGSRSPLTLGMLKGEDVADQLEMEILERSTAALEIRQKAWQLLTLLEEGKAIDLKDFDVTAPGDRGFEESEVTGEEDAEDAKIREFFGLQ
jgi:uncharacterized protein YigA (DUF484 family)